MKEKKERENEEKAEKPCQMELNWLLARLRLLLCVHCDGRCRAAGVYFIGSIYALCVRHPFSVHTSIVYVYIKFPSRALNDIPTIADTTQPRIIVILTITIIVKAIRRLVTSVCFDWLAAWAAWVDMCVCDCWANKFAVVVTLLFIATSAI